MPNHTPEPWRPHHADPFAVFKEKTQVANCGVTGHISSEECIANRDHIVACVNACKGINPEWIPQLIYYCKTLGKIGDGKFNVSSAAMIGFIMERIDAVSE